MAQDGDGIIAAIPGKAVWTLSTCCGGLSDTLLNGLAPDPERPGALGLGTPTCAGGSLMGTIR
uniref:Uncharacterized protein n=1 Tax=Oryza barthii TaxID=65489 RepID=A0A0D3GIB9_9ORYZ